MKQLIIGCFALLVTTFLQGQDTLRYRAAAPRDNYGIYFLELPNQQYLFSWTSSPANTSGPGYNLETTICVLDQRLRLQSEFTLQVDSLVHLELLHADTVQGEVIGIFMARSAGLTNYLYVAEIDLEQRRLLYKASVQIASNNTNHLTHDIRRSVDRRSLLFCIMVKSNPISTYGILSLQNFTFRSSNLFIEFERYHEFVERPGGKGYYMLGSGILTLDEDLNIVFSDWYPLEDQWPDPDFKLLLSRDTFFVGGGVGFNVPNDVVLNKMRSDLSLIRQVQWGSPEGYHDHFAQYNPIDISDDGEILYLGATTNAKFMYLSFSKDTFQNGWFLGKYNRALEKQFEKTFTFPGEHIFLNGVKSLSNGKCALYGVSYRYETETEAQGLVLVIDANGDLLSTTRIPGYRPKLQVFPNPADASFQVLLPEFLEKSALELYDTKGRLVASQVVLGTRLEFVTSHIPSGSYYLHWKQKHGYVASSPVMVAH